MAVIPAHILVPGDGWTPVVRPAIADSAFLKSTAKFGGAGPLAGKSLRPRKSILTSSSLLYPRSADDLDDEMSEGSPDIDLTGQSFEGSDESMSIGTVGNVRSVIPVSSRATAPHSNLVAQAPASKPPVAPNSPAPMSSGKKAAIVVTLVAVAFLAARYFRKG